MRKENTGEIYESISEIIPLEICGRIPTAIFEGFSKRNLGRIAISGRVSGGTHKNLQMFFFFQIYESITEIISEEIHRDKS